MAIGYLLIQARTAHDAVPLSGVQIQITDQQGNRVYELTTDANGEAQKIPLETLNQSFSQNPYFAGTPYISYNVLARKNGFNSLYISEIPIFDGETAVLPLTLVPMQALQPRSTQTEISIGSPAVAMNEPRNQEGVALLPAMRRRPMSGTSAAIPEVIGMTPAPGTSSSMPDSVGMNPARTSAAMPNAAGMTPAPGTSSSMPDSVGMNPARTSAAMPNAAGMTPAPGTSSSMPDSVGMNPARTSAAMPNAAGMTPAPGTSASMPDTFRISQDITSGQNQEAQTEGSRILRQVAIPNLITVHLGAPNAAAANVQVSFPDYVKNAASSEIYPTWPDASLRANIYAIITFALNRIFTEWYRSREYQFDITNSTAYDQAFVYGRPIYDSVSRIVDEIFNQYVRRPGQIAPYFTSFCNGTTVSCQGLSQWGTVTLANQGLTPLQILRSYYPSDVEIVETNIVTGALSSYPGTPLRTGSTGLDVQTIQTYLNRIRRNYPAIPAITDETGVFQDSTKAAVTKFQNIFSLTPDGIVGKATWYKISSIYAGITRLAELDSEGTSLGIGTVPPSSVLRQGSRGQDVITLQYLLDVISEYYPGVPAPAQDGIFGSGTRQAVIAFQQLMGLTGDGMVGPLTWDALYRTYQGIQQNFPNTGTGSGTPPDTNSGVIEYTVKAGDSLWLISRRYGTTVEALKRLNGLTSDLLNIGQVLKIPVSQNTSYIEYTVRPGDSLWTISRRYGTTVEAIMNLNGLTSDALGIGQILRIPV